MGVTVTELSRKVPTCLPVLLAVAVMATVLTRYLADSCHQSACGSWVGNGTTAVAAFAAHAHHGPMSAVRVAALNAVRISISWLITEQDRQDAPQAHRSLMQCCRRRSTLCAAVIGFMGRLLEMSHDLHV
jgi:hypothetical protein